MRAAISSVVLAAAIAIAAQTSAQTGIVISNPLGKPLDKNVLVRGGVYYASNPVLCRTATTPPKIRFNGAEIGATTCQSVGNAVFRVNSGAPGNRGILSIVHAGGEVTVGTYDLVAPPPQLILSPATLSFTASPWTGNDPPDRQTFEIRNGGGGTLSWTISEGYPWLMVRANEQCTVVNCPDCFTQCSTGIAGSSNNSGATTISGTGNAIVAVRAPGFTLPSGTTVTGTISITTNGGNANVTVTVTTPANVEFDCRNYAADDDNDGEGDSLDDDCAPNPWAGV